MLEPREGRLGNGTVAAATDALGRTLRGLVAVDATPSEATPAGAVLEHAWVDWEVWGGLLVTDATPSEATPKGAILPYWAPRLLGDLLGPTHCRL